MAADRAYVSENRAELERLRALVDRLSDQELSRPMEAGWTVAGVLAHLAFWDYRVVTLVDQWAHEGRGMVPGAYDEAAVDWINDASKPLCLGLPPRVAARMAIDAAVAADQRVSGLLRHNSPRTKMRAARSACCAPRIGASIWMRSSAPSRRRRGRR